MYFCSDLGTVFTRLTCPICSGVLCWASSTAVHKVGEFILYEVNAEVRTERSRATSQQTPFEGIAVAAKVLQPWIQYWMQSSYVSPWMWNFPGTPSVGCSVGYNLIFWVSIEQCCTRITKTRSGTELLRSLRWYGSGISVWGTTKSGSQLNAKGLGEMLAFWMKYKCGVLCPNH